MYRYTAFNEVQIQFRSKPAIRIDKKLSSPTNCEGFNLAALVSCNSTGRSRPRSIFQTIFNAQILVGNRLGFHPTISPALCRIDTDCQIHCYRTIGSPLSSCQNNAPSHSDLLTNMMAMNQLFQTFPLCCAQIYLCSFWSWHSDSCFQF